MRRFVALYALLVLVLGGAAAWTVVDLVRPDSGAGLRRAQAAEARSVSVSPEPALPPLALDGLKPSPLPLSLPLACDPGRDCWVVNYVDRDTGPGWRDFSCGAMSYDGHKGTDIALAHEGRLAEDVAVFAAAPGRVVGTRDGVADINVAAGGKDAVANKECGNGVRIDHGGGWATQYCHLRKGSVRVKTGATVASGDRIGSVGLSGMTEFPHLHIQVEKDGKIVDPFVGLAGDGEVCGLGAAPLWTAAALQKLRYRSPFVPNAGFADAVPEIGAARAGQFARVRVDRNSPALVFWAELYGVRAGDRLTLRLLGPDGETVASLSDTQARNQIRTWKAAGRKARGTWAPGTYTGVVEVARAGEPGEKSFSRRYELRID